MLVAQKKPEFISPLSKCLDINLSTAAKVCSPPPPRPIRPVQCRHGLGTAADGLGVVTQCYGGIGVPGQLGHEADLDALGL